MIVINTWSDLYNVSEEMIFSASDDELDAIYRRLSKPVGISPMDKTFAGFYSKKQSKAIQDLYWLVSNEIDNRYSNAHEGELIAYFNKWFRGKTIEEIRADEELSERWNFYSDFHKDVYGYRPRSVSL